MNDPAVPRRTFIGWVVSSLVVAPFAASASVNTTWQADLPLPQRADRLFAGRLPAQAKQVLTRFASGVYVSVYELSTEDGHGARSTWSIKRWLCMASEVEAGKFVIQTSGDALYESTNWHPTDVLEVTVLESGDVEVAQGLLRGSDTTRWSRSGNNWELAAMRSAGISAHRYYEEEYDRETHELVVRTGDQNDDLLETRRYAVAENFTLADYGNKPLVDFA